MKDWVTTKEFADLRPCNHFGKEMSKASDAGIADAGQKGSLRNCHTLFRKLLYLPEGVPVSRSYRLKITADDYYKLYMNGSFLGQGPANAYHFVCHYNEYDITPYLKEGENILAVHVYYQGVINRVFNSGDNRQGLWAELYADGIKVGLQTSGWKYQYDRSFQADSECIGYQTQFLEHIDARLQEKGWKLPGFDDSAWEDAVIKEDDDHCLVPEPSVPVEVTEIRPVNVVRFDADNNGSGTGTHFLLDFGKEVTGCLRLTGKRGSDHDREDETRGAHSERKTITAKEAPGSRIRIRWGEELNPDGHVRYEMRCNLRYEEIWTLSGSGEDDVIENYDYKGFRYAEVLSEDGSGAIGPDHFTLLLRHYPVGQSRKPVIKDELLSRIWDICENGVIMGTQEAFLDCPTREKGQYLGDLTVTALSHYYISGDYALYRKALKDFADTRFICPGLLAVAPGEFMQEIADFSLLYPLQLQNYYRISGDAQFVRELLPIAEAAVNHFAQFRRGDGLLSGVTDKWNLVDWPQNLRDDYDFPLTKPIGEGCHNVINAYYYGAMKVMNELWAEFGLPSKYDTSRFRDAFYRAFYNGRVFTDSEGSDHAALHSNVLPLFYRMTAPEETEAVKDLIMEKGFSCGVFFAYFVLKALTGNGYKREALALMKNTGEHSWYQMLTEGATSCFEAWGRDQKWNTSLCHPWASAPIIVLSEDFSADDTIMEIPKP